MAQVPPQLAKYVFKKGNKLGGRKPNKSLKEYSREYLASMTEAERLKYLNSLDPEIIWKMAEGNPKDVTELKGKLTISEVLDDLENGSETKEQGVENK